MIIHQIFLDPHLMADRVPLSLSSEALQPDPLIACARGLHRR